MELAFVLAYTGAGETIELGVNGVTDGRLCDNSGAFGSPCDKVCVFDPRTSSSTEPSLPFSTIAVFVSCDVSVPVMILRNSYRIGENLTATLAFLCPGS